MAFLLTLIEDGPLGKAGTQVWVDDPKAAEKPAPRKATHARKPTEK